MAGFNAQMLDFYALFCLLSVLLAKYTSKRVFDSSVILLVRAPLFVSALRVLFCVFRVDGMRQELFAPGERGVSLCFVDFSQRFVCSFGSRALDVDVGAGGATQAIGLHGLTG